MTEAQNEDDKHIILVARGDIVVYFDWCALIVIRFTVTVLFWGVGSGGINIGSNVLF